MIHERYLNDIIVNEIKKRISQFVANSDKAKIETILIAIYLEKFNIEDFKRRLNPIHGIQRDSDLKFYREEDIEKNINELLGGI